MAARETTQRIAVIGGGVQGVVSAKVYQECGFEVVLIERQDKLGGQWNDAYPGARIQVRCQMYSFPTYQWPEERQMDHPTAEEVSAYVNEAAAAFKLNVRLESEVLKMEEIIDASTRTNVGWKVTVQDNSAAGGGRSYTENFDIVAIATGTNGPAFNRTPQYPGVEKFRGKLATQHDSYEDFDNKDVVVLGNGRAAIDMAVIACERPAVKSVTQIIRGKRWGVPDIMGGKPFEETLLSRFGAIMVTCWDHSLILQRFLHRFLSGFINFFWETIVPNDVFTQHRNDARSASVEAKPGQVEDLSRCEVLLGKSETEPFAKGIRNGAIYPTNYMRHVALGNIIVKQGLVDGLTPSGVHLESGETYDADTVLTCFGASKLYFPMLPQKYRDIMEAHRYGVQLFRHTIHPDIPNVVFHGLNSGFLMIVTNEIAALWNVARLWGVLKLPPREEMLEEMERIAAWKDANVTPSQPHYFGIGGRCVYLVDKMMHDLKLNRFRKMPNLYAEIFTSYKDRDYKDAQAEFLQKYASRKPTSLTAVTPASPTSKKEL